MERLEACVGRHMCVRSANTEREAGTAGVRTCHSGSQLCSLFGGSSSNALFVLRSLQLALLQLELLLLGSSYFCPDLDRDRFETG